MEHDPQTRQDMNIPMIVTITAMSVVMLLVIVTGVEAWFRWEFDRAEQIKKQRVTNDDLIALRAGQQATLDNAPISIEQAMQMVIEDAAK